MNKIILFCTLAVFSASSVLADDSKKPLTKEEDKLGYSIGLNFARSIKNLSQDVKLDIPMVVQGFKDGLYGDKVLISQEEFTRVMADFQVTMKEKQAELQKEAAEKKKQEMAEQGKKNEAEGKAFLAENSKKAGIKITSSGLQYEIVKAGTGKNPKISDQVETHYRGTFLNGDEFDSSYKRGKPATFPLSGVIPGWTEALQLMKVGGKWKIFVPYDLAYGKHGAGKMIGPNSTLIFEIELLAIKN